jgi:hypothetical protein
MKTMNEFLGEGKYKVHASTDDGDHEETVDASNPVSARAAVFAKLYRAHKKNVRIRGHEDVKESKTSELKKGSEREMEHTDDPKVAAKIARDHVKERPNYYSKLDKCMPESVNEGWHREKKGGTMWSADAAELDHHLKSGKGPVRCPHCRQDLSFKAFKPHRDREGDVTHATHLHSCGHHLTLFND